MEFDDENNNSNDFVEKNEKNRAERKSLNPLTNENSEKNPILKKSNTLHIPENFSIKKQFTNRKLNVSSTRNSTMYKKEEINKMKYLIHEDYEGLLFEIYIII